MLIFSCKIYIYYNCLKKKSQLNVIIFSLSYEDSNVRKIEKSICKVKKRED